MGFCFLNNVVIAARRAQELGRARVLIVDWDVHHGNGTQALVERDPSIRYVSMHQYPWYPGTGAAQERGVGNVFNVPRPPGLPRARPRACLTGRPRRYFRCGRNPPSSITRCRHPLPMALRLAIEECTLTTRHPFAIARGSTTGYRRVWVRVIDEDGLEGWGEADPSSYYGENYDTVRATIERLAPHLPRGPFRLGGPEDLLRGVAPHQAAAARAALSAALHDLC